MLGVAHGSGAVRRDVSGVGFTRLDECGLLRVDVEADCMETSLGELHREREDGVAEADHTAVTFRARILSSSESLTGLSMSAIHWNDYAIASIQMDFCRLAKTRSIFVCEEPLIRLGDALPKRDAMTPP